MANLFPSGTFVLLPANDAVANLATGISASALSFTLDNNGTPPTGLIYAFANFADPTVANQELLTVKMDNEYILLYDYNPSTGLATVYDEDTHGYGVLSAGENGRGFQGVGQSPSGAATHLADIAVYSYMDEFVIKQIQAAIKLKSDTASTVLTNGANPVTYIELTEQGSAPSTPVNAGRVYTQEVAGVTEYFYKDSAGNEVQLTNNGQLNTSGVDETANFDWTGDHDFQAGFQIGGVDATPLADGSPTTIHYHPITKGVVTRASATGSGSETIAHGLGTTPKYIRILAFSSSLGASWSDGNAKSTGDENCLSWDTAAFAIQGGYALYVVDSAGTNYWRATLTTLDATNIVLSTTKVGTTGDLTIKWEAWA